MKVNVECVKSKGNVFGFGLLIILCGTMKGKIGKIFDNKFDDKNML